MLTYYKISGTAGKIAERVVRVAKEYEEGNQLCYGYLNLSRSYNIRLRIYRIILCFLVNLHLSLQFDFLYNTMLYN